MSLTLVLLVVVVFSALSFWAGCRYGCEGVARCFAWLGRMLYCFFEVILIIICLVIFLVFFLVALIIWAIMELINWIVGLPWGEWWKSLRWLWWILGGLMLILALILALIGFIPAAITFAILGALLWLMLLGLLFSIIALILGLLSWFSGIFESLVKWLALSLAGLSLTLPTCSNAPESVELRTEAAIPQTLALPSQKESACTIVLIKKGDGAIRATARGGHPLNLVESIEWTRQQGLPVRTVGRYIQAPTLYMSDHIKWCDEKAGWILVRP